MDTFHVPKLEDRDWVRPIVKASGAISCDAAFGTIYIWRKAYCTRICHFEDYLLTAYLFDKGNIYYDYPIGTGDISRAIKLMEDYAKKIDRTPFFSASGLKQCREMKRLLPNYTCKELRDNYEYVYLSESLAMLKGRKLHGKRNHLNNFKSKYSYSYEELDKHNFNDALYVVKKWYLQHTSDEEDNEYEAFAINEAFKYYKELKFKGGLLKVDNLPVAMTLGEAVTDNCFVVHFEKALNTVDNAYAAINNMFSQTLTQYKYVNREEDLGIEGLRKAKLSYRPQILLEKFTFFK